MTLRVMTNAKAFGARLRWWREHRGLSQLDLAGSTEVSQRHLSFLESGRAIAVGGRLLFLRGEGGGLRHPFPLGSP